MQNAFPPLTIMQEFRRAKAVCQRNPGIRQICRTDKSSAQVALSVEQQVVERKACGLKPDQAKSSRLAVRLSDSEREFVSQHAKTAHLTLSEYFRASILGPGYVSRIDPTKRQLLLDVSRELGRHGNNLNQIAHHLNAGIIDPINGHDTLSVLARSLLSAYQNVRESLTEGKQY